MRNKLSGTRGQLTVQFETREKEMPDKIEPVERKGAGQTSKTGGSECSPRAGSCLTRDTALLVLMSEERRAQLLWDVQRVTKCSEEAEDIVQEALLRAWRNLQQFRGDAQISTWVRAIVRNTAREWLRNRGSRVNIPIGTLRTEEDEFPVLELTDMRPDPEECYARREMEELLHAEIEALSMVSRTAIELCALKEQSLREAARTLNVNVITVKSRLFRGRQLLQRGLCHRTGGREHCHVP